MNRRRYLINDGAFDKLSKEAAYWVGFLFADGYMNFQRGDIKINLAEKDAGHLFKLRRFLGSNYRIFKYSGVRFGKRHFGQRIDFRSKRIANRLKQFGWRNKSDHRPVQCLTNNIDFWRGVVDGDGHLGITGNKPRFILVGTRRIVSAFLKFAKRRLPYLRCRITDRGSICGVSSSSRPAQAIIKLLYYGSKIHLDRKKALSERIIPLLLPDRTAKPRRKEIDETAFNSITDESTYWIGYMFAGSYIGLRAGGQTSVEVHVGFKDRNYLKRLRSFLKSNYRIQSNDISSRFSFRSDAIVSALGRYGIVHGKENRRVAPILTHNRDFWRGVLDANGCVSVTKKSPPSISLSGNKRIVSNFIRYAKSLFNTKKRARKIKGVNSWQTSFSHRQARLLLTHLYRRDDMTSSRRMRLVRKIISKPIFFRYRKRLAIPHHPPPLRPKPPMA